jgi:hypothetical protein
VTLPKALERIQSGRARSVMALCPAHGDRSPSLSVGRGKDGRVLLYCNAGCPFQSIIEAAGLTKSDLHGNAALSQFCTTRGQRERIDDPSKAEERARWPALETPAPEDLEAIVRARRIPVEGLRLAVARGILWTATNRGTRSWIVCDQARMAAQARRLDGKPWPAKGRPPYKADTLLGSTCAWPIGLAALKPEHRAVLLVEGGPDLLAAHAVIHAEAREADAAAVTMLGATNNPRESELHRFTGRTVRIVEHDDDAGRKAGKRWAVLLRPHVESVDGLRLTGLVRADGQPCKDLNDLLLVSESNLRNANLPPVIP